MLFRSDMTCDSDGKIANFVSSRADTTTLPLHSLRDKEHYYLAVFLVGAYQEILGDMHNLFGDTNAIFTLEIAQLPGSEDLTVGQQVYLSNQYGQPFPVKVTAKEETTITFDANHEMAGKELNFKIELVEVK